MTIQECYRQLDGNFGRAKKLLTSEPLVKRFIVMFLEDDSFRTLCTAMEQGCCEEAFRAAHTLKGICGNLSLDRLYDSASQLAELLRPGNGDIPLRAYALFEAVKVDYQLTACAIRDFRDSNAS